jgi:TonB family protein
VKSFARILAVALVAVTINVGLYLLVPYIQVLIQRKAMAERKGAKVVTADVAVAPPQTERQQKRVIKEIKTESYRPPSMATARPSMPGGGLKIDLSPAGGDGQSLVSGGDRTGGIGSGTGGGQGSGIAAMIYEPGQTDTDARITGPDPAPDMPPRAEREGVSGTVILTFVVNEMGMPENITLIKEEPAGFGFGAKAIQQARGLRFTPATFQGMSVKQRFKRTYNFDMF